ncbi:MAG: tetratricopeptide repeat protein [Caldilineaceae bacterium]|nr:tetratricopeptide repeat protein [Caldilineaceae bacterium]
MPDTELFRTTLSAGIQRIRQLEGKPIGVIQDELGYAIGRETGGSAIEHWRKGNLPSNLRELAALAREILLRTDLEVVWLQQLLTAADFPYPEQFATELFAELGRGSAQVGSSPISEPPSQHVSALTADWQSINTHQHFHRFVGRQAIITQLNSWLHAQNSYPVIGIDGMGGVGKTSLVQAVTAQEAQRGLFDAFCWIRVGRAASQPEIPVSSEQPAAQLHGDVTYPALLHTIGQALGGEAAAALPVAEQEAKLKALLRRRRLLLVIDNLEAAPGLQAELPARLTALLGQSRALLTSRLRFQGNLHVIHLTGFTADEALEFLATETALRGEEQVAAVPAAQLAAIAQTTGSLPFALKLVVGQLDLFPSDVILRELNALSATATELLPVGRPTLYTYLFGAAWQALTDEQRTLLATMVLFAPTQGCNFAALHAVSGMAESTLLPMLTALWKVSLVDVQGGNRHNLLQKRYLLHPLTHQFVESQLQEASPALMTTHSSAHNRYITYFSMFVATHSANYAILAGENDNVTRALQLALAANDTVRFVETVCGLCPFWAAYGFYQQAAEWLTLAQRAVEQQMFNERLSPFLPLLLLQQATFAEKQGEFARTVTVAQQALALAETVDGVSFSPDLRGSLLHCLGRAQTNLGDYDTAIQTLEASFRLVEHIPDAEDFAMLHASLGKVQRLRGDFGSAEQHLKRGLQFAQRQGDQETVSLFWMNLGSLAGQLGQFDQADLYLNHGLEIAQALGLRPRIGRLFHLLGGTATMRGDHANAEALSLAGLEIAREIGDLDMECVLLMNLGVIAGNLEDYAACRRYGEEALAAARLMNHPERITGALTNLARLAEFQKNYIQAAIYLDEALELVETLDSPWSKGDVWIGFGRLHLAQGNYADANRWLEKGLNLGRAICIPELEGDACYLLAQTANAQAELDAARRWGEEALRIYQAMQHVDTAEVEKWLTELI